MPRDAALRALDDSRRGVFLDGCRGIQLERVTRLWGERGDWHCVSWSGLAACDADAAIDVEIEYFRRLRAEFEWTVYAHDAPADLLERLRRRGFEVGEREAIMMLDLTQASTWLDASPTGVVTRVTTPDQVEVYRCISDRAFEREPPAVPHPSVGELLAALEQGSEDHVAYLAHVGETVAGAARLDARSGVQLASLYGGGILPEHRGKGLYRALVAARGRDARRLGARYLRVDALPTSRPILERLGFVEVTQAWPCTWRPDSVP